MACTAPRRGKFCRFSIKHDFRPILAKGGNQFALVPESRCLDYHSASREVPCCVEFR